VEQTINNFYGANILSSMKNLNKICEKNSIVNNLKKVMTKLDSHFNIFTQQKLKEETRNIDTNNDRQLDSFLQKVILRIHHKIIRVPKKK